MSLAMTSESSADYDRIADAIDFIADRIEQQPTLDEVAAHLNLSAFHFQRLFTRWAGVTPKRFLQVLTVRRAKELLSESASLLDVAHSIGLSSGSRLYDHFVKLDAVTPGEFKKRGDGLTIEFGTHPTPFGDAFVATTPRGVCGLSFLDVHDVTESVARLSTQWPRARLLENGETTQRIITTMFGPTNQSTPPRSLHVTGTNFQINVWRALLELPPGALASYSWVAQRIGAAGSARAVGRAVGSNPVALLIPCHRIIQKSGDLGGYHWGLTRKRAIHAWEAARTQ
jgi:AraC family transcriptional regulator of adaptative response/methylated-DNA-[protein]-cysteine methyltransferase